MKTSSIIKAVVAVTTIVTVGKMVYDKVKTNKENNTENDDNIVEESVEEPVKDPADESETNNNVVDTAIDIFNNLSAEEQTNVILAVGGMAFGIIFVCKHIIRGIIRLVKYIISRSNHDKYDYDTIQITLF